MKKDLDKFEKERYKKRDNIEKTKKEIIEKYNSVFKNIRFSFSSYDALISSELIRIESLYKNYINGSQQLISENQEKINKFKEDKTNKNNEINKDIGFPFFYDINKENIIQKFNNFRKEYETKMNEIKIKRKNEEEKSFIR